MKKFSIIIPFYNEEERLKGLFESIQKINYPKDFFEVIAVNDGSTDDSAKVAKQFQFVKLVELEKNEGRFVARNTGAESAKYDDLLFIDSRVVVDPEILNALNKSDYQAVVGHSLGAQKETIFEVYYSAIRRLMFKDITDKKLIELTPENFDDQPKGTGVFYVKKYLWEFGNRGLENKGGGMSDDTKILRRICDKVPISIDPDVKIVNFGRKDLVGSIKHLFERGKKFTDYYLDPSKKKFWLVIVAPIIGIFLILGFLLAPVLWIYKIILIIFVDLLVSIVLANSLLNFLKIAIIQPIIIITFYSGIIVSLLQSFIKIVSKTLKKKKIRETIQKIITIFVFVAIGYYLYVNQEVFQSLQNVKLYHIAFIFMIEIFATSMYAIINHQIIKSIQPGVPFIDNFLLQFSNSLLNKILPKGGAVYRAYYLNEKYKFPYSKYVASIAGLYIISFLTYSLWALVIFVILYLQTGFYSVLLSLAFLALFFGTLFVIIVNPVIVEPSNRFMRILKSILDGWNLIKKDKKLVLQTFLLTSVILILVGIEINFVFQSLGVETSLISTTYMSIVSLLTIFINITPDGIGVKEAVLVYSSRIVGLEDAVTVFGSIVLRGITLVESVILGGISFLLLSIRLRTKTPKEKDLS